jgi:hypothetical protein
MTDIGEAAGLRRSTEERKATLDSALQRYGAQGWRVETRSEFQATIAKGKEVNHLLHLFLAVITFGLWLIPWLILGVGAGVKRRMVTIDEFGNAVDQKL